MIAEHKQYTITIVVVVVIFLLVSIGSVLISVRSITEHYSSLIQDFVKQKTADYYSQSRFVINTPKERMNSSIFNLHEYLKADKAISKIGFYNLIILDVNGNFIYNYIKYDNLFKSNVEERALPKDYEYTLKPLQQAPYSVEVTSYTKTLDGVKYLFVYVPYIDKLGGHYYDFIYIFSIDKILNKNLKSHYWFASVCFLFFCIIIFLFHLYRTTLKNAIASITLFISNEIFANQRKQGILLHFIPLFEKLEIKITYLLAQKKEMEAKFLEISEKYNLLMEQTNDGIVIEDLDGIIYFANNRAATIMGYQSESSLLGHKLVELLNDSSAYNKYDLEIDNRSINESFPHKIDFITSDNKKVICLLSSREIKDSRKDIMGYFTTLTDITELENIQRSIAEKQLVKANVFDNSEIPMFYLQDGDTIMEANYAFCDLVSIPKTNLIGLNIQSALGQFEFASRIINELRLNKKTEEFEIIEPYLSAWLLIHINTISNDTNTNVIVTIVNISRFRAEERFHQIILNEIKGFIFIADAKNNVLYISPGFQKITGYSKDWFENYLKQILETMGKNSIHLIENFVVTRDRKKYSFVADVFPAIGYNVYICKLL